MKRTLTLVPAALALIVATAFAAPKHAPPAAPADSAAAPANPTAAPADSAAAPGAAHEDGLLVAALDRMAGVVPGSDSLVAWDLFRAHARRTVELILPTLKPVRRDLYLGAPNMVWRVRVLQRLTGREFRAPTRAKLNPDEVRALAPDSSHAVRFAGEERALGMTWTAPADAQKVIITRWLQWWEQDVKKPALPMVQHTDDRTWWY